ncbi:serine/threonine-protein kinase [Bythopirellula goksoeyrii]|uniref:non-specific serine/threonine protein kinase n=1 Tax=Bythopirellula goksoeyrii TaxID=1400387 RepID=A0A5B9QCL5_9BACT|nr:serine/threonine-protein kinase [Bythopirellula goksoeyrii]QEG34686.1 Serine/threonine-protein kinase PrkC [Bythopirellula goksoeyrii]
MTAPYPEPESDDRPKAGQRFTYASGSQPLDGYTIKRGVGRGGFGEVYYALSDAGKEVALKLIRRNLDVEIRGVTHCLNLKHANLVAIYDIRTDENDDRWVVMEYVSGESLEDAIDRHPNGMPVDLAIAWFSGIAAGVAYLHDHGIVHRDLKPANIFLDEDTVKIGDYGLSKFISCSRRSGQTESVGTVHYMAPEIANGRYGREIDTYALGIILYEMLTGHVPFEGESVGEVLMKHLTAEPDLQALAEPYRGIVQGAMNKDPETRLRSVAEMLQSMPNGSSSLGSQQPLPRVDMGTTNGEPSVAPAAPRDYSQSAPNQPDEEPILAAITKEWREAKTRFNQSRMHPLLKSALLVVLAIGLLATSPEWVTMGIFLGITYLVYRVIWTIVVQPNKAQSGTGTPRSSIPPAVPPNTYDGKKRGSRRLQRLSRQRQLREYAAAKSIHDRIAELVGGMFFASVVSTIASLVVCLIMASPFSWSLFAWMTAVSSLGCWAIMIPTKLNEGKIEDQAPLRFIQLLSGAAVGVLAWAFADWLMLSQGTWNDMGIKPGQSLLSGTLGIKDGLVGQLPLQIYAAYFAFLFVLVAWWEQAESTRSSRVSIWAIIWCGFLAWLLHFVWWFPQPLGILVAAIMSFTLQFASPWLPPSRRRAIAEQGGM